MNFEQEEEYMSEPVDEMSESSYIKINKKFLECLKGVNDMDDLSRFRPDSDDEDNNESFNSKYLNKNYVDENNSSEGSEEREVYSTSPQEYKFYKNFYENKDINAEKSMNFSEFKNRLKGDEREENLSNNLDKNLYEDHHESKFRKSPKISNDHSKIENKEKTPPIENTFEYYLTRKSHEQKFEDTSKQSIKDFENEENEKSTKYNKPFSPQHRFSASNRFGDVSFNLESEMQRINYKKLLENEISKNKQLERHIYKLESKLTELNLHYDESFKSSKKLEKDLLNSEKVRKENRHRMKQLDGKLEDLKSNFRSKKTENEEKILNYRKENKLLKQENEKYKIFVETLSESIFVLKGHKPKKLEDIWEEWKTIFETFSRKKWTKSRGKSPNSKIEY